jgi:hypothetical protein
VVVQKENGVTLLTEGSMSYQQLSPLFTTVAGWTSILVQLNRHRWKSKREGDHDCGEVSHGLAGFPTVACVMP